MNTVVDYLIGALAKDYMKHPSKYADYGFLAGMQVAKAIYNQSGYFNLTDVENMTEEERLSEALAFMGLELEDVQ